MTVWKPDYKGAAATENSVVSALGAHDARVQPEGAPEDVVDVEVKADTVADGSAAVKTRRFEAQFAAGAASRLPLSSRARTVHLHTER